MEACIRQRLLSGVRFPPVAIPASEPGTLQIPSVDEGGGRRLRKAANWASVRTAGKAGAVGRRRGSERPFEASAPRSYPSPAPWASGDQGLRRLFVKRGRGSLAFARPCGCLQCHQGAAAPRPDRPRTNLLLWRQLLPPPTRRESHGPKYARSRPRPAALLPLRPFRRRRRRL